MERIFGRVPDTRRGLALLTSAALLWSSGGLFIKVITLSGYHIAGYRSLISALAILVILKARGRRFEFPRDLTSWIGAGCYSLVLVLFVLATKLTTAANAIFLQYAAPVYLLFLEPWIFRKPLDKGDFWAVGACLGGMALFFADRLEAGGLLGNILALVSGVMLAMFSLALKWRRVQRPDSDPIGIVVVGNLLVALICLPKILPAPGVSLPQALGLVYLGVFQLGIAYMLFSAGMHYVSATAAMITCMLEAVFNPVWVVLGTGERPSPFALVGGVVILGVVLVYNLRSKGA